MWYLIFILIGMFALYFFWPHLASLFNFYVSNYYNRQTVYSLIIITSVSLFIYWYSQKIIDLDFGNRILHSLGGGLVAYLVGVLSVVDKKISISRLSFFVLSLLLISTLGVVNEIVEYILQNCFHLLNAAETINDTWLDLISNTFGILLGAILFTPLISNRKKTVL